MVIALSTAIGDFFWLFIGQWTSARVRGGFVGWTRSRSDGVCAKCEREECRLFGERGEGKVSDSVRVCDTDVCVRTFFLGLCRSHLCSSCTSQSLTSWLCPLASAHCTLCVLRFTSKTHTCVRTDSLCLVSPHECRLCLICALRLNRIVYDYLIFVGANNSASSFQSEVKR